MGEDLSFFFFSETTTSQRSATGPTLGKAAHIKLQSCFAQNLNKKFDRRSEKKAVQKTELHFI